MEKGFRITSYIICVVLAILLFKACSDKSDMARNMSIEVANVMEYEAKNGELIEYNDVMSTKYKDLELYNSKLKDEIDNMKIKNPEVVIRNTTNLRIDTIYVSFTDTLPCDDFVKNILIDSSFYNIDMTMTKKDLTINEISIPNEQIIVVGEKKNGIFKRNEYVVSVKNTNPHIKTDTLETYSFKKDVKFFKRPIVNLIIGAAAGIVITKLIGK